MRRVKAALVVVPTLLHAASALAQSVPAPSARAGTSSIASRAGPASVSTGAGLAVIFASIAAGAALTIYGLSIDCEPLDSGCHRRASLPIAGGVGLAATGSLVGFFVIHSTTGANAAALAVGGRF